MSEPDDAQDVTTGDRPRPGSGAGLRRVLPALHRGARIGLVVAALLVVLALYHLFLPVDLRTSSGALIRCGSAAHPPHGAFQVNTCGSLVDRQQTKVTFWFVAAGVVALGSVLAFGRRSAGRP